MNRTLLVSLFRLQRGVMWALPLIALLGALSSLVEGIGIGMFLPLLDYFSSSSNGGSPEGWLAGAVAQVVSLVPIDNRLAAVSAVILASIVAKAALTFGNRVMSAWISTGVGHRIRSGIFKQLLSVEYSFLEQAESGAHLNTLATETWRVVQALNKLNSAIASLFTTFVFLGILMVLSWQLTIIVVLAMGLIALVVRPLTTSIWKLGKAATSANALLAKRMVEGLAGMSIIRMFVRERHELNRFDGASKGVKDSFFKMDMIGAAIAPAYEILSAVVLVGMLFYTDMHGMDLPMILVFVLILTRLEPRVKELDEARVSLQSNAAAVEQVSALLELHNKQSHTPGTTRFTSLKDRIAFEGVTFRYRPHRPPALHEISGMISRGKTTAIVGPSGAGKSTMIKLLLRLYDVSEGRITVDGVPINALDIASWRKRIAVVSQDVFLFDATVKENIAYGKDDATEEEIRSAARQADAERFIAMLPNGYDTLVGDSGNLLSTGQRQRIALARAIICKPDILVLDEAMNALDSISEHLIQDALDVLQSGTTVILIAHRLSTIRRADHIIVLYEGRVREQGTLQELGKSSTFFSKLYSTSTATDETCVTG